MTEKERRIYELTLRRKVANQKIISKIMRYIDKHPDQRFIQALQNLGIISGYTDKMLQRFVIDDRFYEESEDTLEKMK